MTNKINFLKASERKRLISELNELFGIEDLPRILVGTGKGKIRGFTGNMTKQEMREISGIANIEIIGTYLVKRDERLGLRLSLDATQILKDQIKENIVSLDEEQTLSWFKGNNVEISEEKGMHVIKSKKGDFLGCGFSDSKKIVNYVPKERRIRKG